MCSVALMAVIAFLPLGFSRHAILEPNRRIPELDYTSFQRGIRSGSGISGGGRRVLEPSLTIRNAPPEFLEVAVSENKVLECEARGNPPPTIHWLKDGQRIPQSVYESMDSSANDGNEDITPVLGLSFTKSRLYVDCVGPQEEGEYTCVAENPFTRVSRTTRLSILDWTSNDGSALCLAKKSFGAPARIHMWTHTRLELMGSDVQLFCRSDGEPRPKVMWFGPNENRLEESEKYQIMGNGDLIIRNIRWSDMGGYTCEVSNPQGSDSTLTFLYPTQKDKRKSKE